jgi:hypothetical protein
MSLAICMFYMITASSGLDPVEFEKLEKPVETEVSSAEVVNENQLGEFVITAYTAGYESTGKNPDIRRMESQQPEQPYRKAEQ